MGSLERFTEQGVQRVRSFAMHGRRGMRVQVEGDRNGGGAEHFGDEFRVEGIADTCLTTSWTSSGL